MERPVGTASEVTRVLRLAGVLAWLMVGFPVARGGIGRPEAFAVWLGCFVAFGALYAWTTVRLHARRAVILASLAAQAGCVIAMTARQCRGMEGTLLVLVAMQLGLVASRRAGLAWIAIQSLALAWAIAHHWSASSAILLTPPYLGFQVLAFFVLETVRRESEGRSALAQANAELRSTRELLAETARLNERLRIARELHDAMGHHLAALSLNLEAVGEEASPSPALGTARTLTRRLLDDVESIVQTLGQDPGVDLGQALQALAAAVPRPIVHVDAPDVVLRDPQRAHALLRCCQEIVTNSVKHAAADNVWLAIRIHDRFVELRASDDGAGAERLGIGQGLQGMRQRLEEMGGTLDLETSPGRGFRLHASFPVETAVPRSAASAG